MSQPRIQFLFWRRKKKRPELSSQKATLLAASFPGLGQIYNRKYWKIPFVYAGFGGMGYAVTYNSTWYNNYIRAYQDFKDEIPETDSYVRLIRSIPPEEYDPVLHPATANPSTTSYIEDQLIRQISYFRKYRDLSYIGIGIWYIITILDANVDASLSNYDVSENLGLSIAPIQVPLYNFAAIGINLTMKINF